MDEFTLSICKSSPQSGDQVLEPVTRSFDEWCEQFSTPLPGVKHGSYFIRGAATKRSNSELKSADVAILDGDSSIDPETCTILEGAPAPLLVHEVLKDNDIQHFIYTSHSHGTKGNRFRVVVPIRLKNKSELAAVTDWLVDLCHADAVWLNNATENSTWSQPWYLPRVPTGAESSFEFYKHDTDEIIDVPSIMAKWEKGTSCQSQDAPPASKNNTVPNTPLFKWLDENNHFDGVVSSDGWHSFICCPWYENHTDQDQQGAGYGPPNSGTDEDGIQYVYARFNCFHGHCADKNISDLYEYSISKGYQHCEDDTYYFNHKTLLQITQKIITKTQIDPGHCFEPLNVKILQMIKEKFIPDWQRVRAQFKRISGISITSLEKVINTFTSTEHRVQLLDQGQVAEIIFKRIGKENILHTQQSFWQWNNNIGVWERCDDKELHKITQDYTLGLELNSVTDAFVKGCTNLLKNRTFVRDHKFNRNNMCINLPNGELYYENKKWELKAHCRENYFTSQIPVAYDPEAKAPQFESFLSDIFEGDDNKEEKIQLICMCFGYSLLSTARYEKFIIIIGNGSNGKSVLLEVLKKLLGNKNVAAVQPSEFGNRFQRAHLQGKLANIVSEINEGKPIDDSALKSITSGESTTVEHKHKDPFEIEPYSTCWFGTNHMPQTSDFSNGINRRAIIIPFNRQFEEHEQDKHLKDKLCTELPGVLNLALDGLKKLFVDNEFISLPEVESAKDQWRNENDQVAQFIDDCCEIDPRENLPSKDLFEAYLEWAEKNNIHKDISQNQLSNRLKRYKVKQQKIKGVRCLAGIKLLNSDTMDTGFSLIT